MQERPRRTRGGKQSYNPTTSLDDLSAQFPWRGLGARLTETCGRRRNGRRKDAGLQASLSPWRWCCLHRSGRRATCSPKRNPMPPYSSYDVVIQQWINWVERFPDWAIGGDDWKRYWEPLQPPTEPFRLRRPRVPPSPHRPRVFVSHQQKDKKQALRVAYCANGEGFEYWIDVLDPSLTLLAKRFPSITPQQKHSRSRRSSK